MKLSEQARCLAIFDSLDIKTKKSIYEEMLNLAARVSYGECTFTNHVRKRKRLTKGQLSKFYGLLAQLTGKNIDKFFDSFLER